MRSVPAFVISGVQERWLSTSKVLATLGIQPQRVVPAKPTQQLAEREFIVRRPPLLCACVMRSALLRDTHTPDTFHMQMQVHPAKLQ